MAKKYKKNNYKFNYMKLFKCILVLVLIILAINLIKGKIKKTAEQKAVNKVIEEQEKIPDDSTATIVSIGDTLVHSQNFKDAYDSETGIYDFSSFFKYITNHFDGTVNVGNCEATFAGAKKGYSGYPTFNSPEHLAVDLKELGLNIMTTANNHTLDSGFTGLESTLGYLDEAGLEHTGSARTQEEQDKILMKDLNGIKTAFLAFTYGTNGIPVPQGKEFCVNQFAKWKSDWSSYTIDYDFMKKKIEQAKSEGAEAICVSMHWGIEYQTKENKEQDQLAEWLVKNGVNVILGCHPHVPQPLKMITTTDENGVERKGACIFSMGNFFSAQTFPNTRNTLLLKFAIRKNGQTGEISVDKVNYVPLYVYDNGINAKDRYTILDLDAIIEDYESGKGNWSKSMYDLAKTEKDRLVKIVGPEIDNTKQEENTESDKENTTNTVENAT